MSVRSAKLLHVLMAVYLDPQVGFKGYGLSPAQLSSSGSFTFTDGATYTITHGSESGVVPYLEKLGFDIVGYGCKRSDGSPVYLREIWPTRQEIQEVENKHVIPGMFKEDLPSIKSVENARCLLLLGDSVTTDHISPAGSIARNSPAARFLASRGLTPREFNSYGSRRGNDAIMSRGTFANIRIVNKMVPNPGPRTKHHPTKVRFDTEVDLTYFKNGGILNYMIRKML
ncbi:unnamed protein product [Chilo suppressalis]|uniref:Aconitase A/isopropylmalate dehydratase small subunit swivel domain-containing protein n=1 Tax=Chilo suppressalis TaxID=168631 RepID=A0ABN8B4I8_CHISP|nr:unnamed protein product [Chilo suppressalis]